MKAIVLVVLSTLLSIGLWAQDNTEVKFAYEVDGESKVVKKLKVVAITEESKINLSIKKGEIVVPNTLINQDVKLDFIVNRKTYHFENFHMMFNNESPTWTLKVDEKPFDREQSWFIKDWTMVTKCIYVLDYGNGKQVSEYR